MGKVWVTGGGQRKRTVERRAHKPRNPLGLSGSHDASIECLHRLIVDAVEKRVQGFMFICGKITKPTFHSSHTSTYGHIPIGHLFGAD